eukprot:GILK01004059.1.p1 GENE.GILK01004059.1~~GILK01004059.1.p1  ORF type:complete len:310 (+),score=21.81 GILK01004059.1:49-978(+)
MSLIQNMVGGVTTVVLMGLAVFISYLIAASSYTSNASQFNVDVSAVGTSAPRKILFPLPQVGFDPTEAAYPWKVWTSLGYSVVFATPTGDPAHCDPEILKGALGGFVNKVYEEPEKLYFEMYGSESYTKPLRYSDVKPEEFDAIHFTGGHGAGMTPFLNSPWVHKMALHFLSSNKTVGAICHGVLALSRAIDPQTNRSVLHSRKTTTVPAYLEGFAYYLTRYLAGMGTYQLNTTWPQYCEDEVKQSLSTPENYIRGPWDFMAPLLPGSMSDHRHTFLVEDGNYLSARFWGDAVFYALRFAKKMEEQSAQ